jgi:hypothetical protein
MADPQQPTVDWSSLLAPLVGAALGGTQGFNAMAGGNNGQQQQLQQQQQAAALAEQIRQMQLANEIGSANGNRKRPVHAGVPHRAVAQYDFAVARDSSEHHRRHSTKLIWFGKSVAF